MKKLILFVILAGGVLIWLLGQRVLEVGRLGQSQGQTTAPAKVIVLPSDPQQGVTEAVVTLVVFSDFQCPACKSFSGVLKQLLINFPTQLKIVWKDLPLPYHQESRRAALSAQCAARQGKFWEYHDALYDNQLDLGTELYKDLAAKLSLNPTTWQTCYDNAQTADLLAAGLQQGEELGIDGVPAVFLNGQPISDLTVSGLSKAINEISRTAK